MRTKLTPEQCKVKNWMKANVEDYLLSRGEVSPTLLVEGCVNESGLLDESVLDDETHIVWDLAVDVAEWYEKQ